MDPSFLCASVQLSSKNKSKRTEAAWRHSSWTWSRLNHEEGLVGLSHRLSACSAQETQGKKKAVRELTVSKVRRKDEENVMHASLAKPTLKFLEYLKQWCGSDSESHSSTSCTKMRLHLFCRERIQGISNRHSFRKVWIEKWNRARIFESAESGSCDSKTGALTTSRTETAHVPSSLVITKHQNVKLHGF